MTGREIVKKIANEREQDNRIRALSKNEVKRSAMLFQCFIFDVCAAVAHA